MKDIDGLSRLIRLEMSEQNAYCECEKRIDGEVKGGRVETRMVRRKWLEEGT